LPSKDLFKTTENTTLGFGLGHRRKFGPFVWDLEAGVETSLARERLDRFGSLAGRHPDGIVDAFNSLPVFATGRATFGLGGAGGFGLYAGVKADFQAVSVDRIPLHLRSGSPEEGELYGLRFEYWPKFFFGIRF
jgi:hypothetical protein